MQINPKVIDLSHWDPADDYGEVKAAGIVGVIYKATEGQGYTDDTYVQQQKAAKAVGLKWGSYHFADGSDWLGQVENFMGFACPDPDELFCLDWEDNPGGQGKMSASDASLWISEVEKRLKRPGQCVIYSGNTAKEDLGDDVNEFFGSRRLWLCQYGSSPSWQKSWSKPWLWQFTDGTYGPSPHTIAGVGAPCDVNSWDGSDEALIKEWASGDIIKPKPEPKPDPEPGPVVNIRITTSPGVTVNVIQSES